jgi:transposase
MPNFLTEEQVQILRQAHRTIRDKKLADRIKAVLSLNAGHEYSQIASILLLDEITLRRYVQKFQKEGISGLLELNYTGGQTTLTLVQELELKEYLQENTKRTAKEIVDYVAKTYGVRFSVIGITKLLHRLGFVYKKPKIIPGKANRVKQEQFLSLYRQVKENLGEHDELYFIDSTHPEHNTKPSYGWILKGKANDKFIKTNTGRERLNLNGALSLKGKIAVVLEEKTVNSDSTIKLFKKLGNKHPVGKIYLVLDNASHHRSKQVAIWLKRHRRFKTLFLPSYSPNLNLIERLWRFFHQKITWNRYFETFGEFRRVTLKFFKNLARYGPELDKLLTDNFQLVPDLNLQT